MKNIVSRMNAVEFRDFPRAGGSWDELFKASQSETGPVRRGVLDDLILVSRPRMVMGVQIGTEVLVFRDGSTRLLAVLTSSGRKPYWEFVEVPAARGAAPSSPSGSCH